MDCFFTPLVRIGSPNPQITCCFKAFQRCPIFFLIRYVDHFGISSTKNLTPKTGCFEHSGVHALCCFDHFWKCFTDILDILRPQKTKKTFHFSTNPEKRGPPTCGCGTGPMEGVTKGSGGGGGGGGGGFVATGSVAKWRALHGGKVFFHRKNDGWRNSPFILNDDSKQQLRFVFLVIFYGSYRGKAPWLSPRFGRIIYPGTLKPSTFFNGCFGWMMNQMFI